MSKGERVKLRRLNSSSATIYDLSLAGHSLTITHVDANPILPTKTDLVHIGMGKRCGVEFVADNPGAWLLAARERGFGEGMLRAPIIYQGVIRKEAAPPIFQRGLRFATYWDFQALYPLNWSAAEPPHRFYSQRLSGGMNSPFWSINGYVNPNSKRLVVRQGQRVRIGYGNHSNMPHAMPLHGHFFKVVNPSLQPERWILKVAIIVDPMQRVEIAF